MPLAPGHRRGAVLGLVLAAAASVTLVPGATTTAGAVPSPAVPGQVDRALRTATGTAAVIVEGGGRAAEAAARRLGAVVTRDLPIIDGFAARVPADRVARIADVPGVRSVTPDARMHVQASSTSSSTTYDTLPSVYRTVVGADKLAAAGGNGQGVTVALIDTGVDPMQDLAGRIVPVPNALGTATEPCMDFSGTGTCADQYGHGTFVAGLIAGDGAASNGTYVGAAPKASILSVKIAGADGSADVSNVLAAIQWVVSYRSTFNVSVLNLSLGTDSTNPYKQSPLDYAVERAWNAGMTVVVAASNRGPGTGTISKPADDPFVLTVGAIDDGGTAGLGDDSMPNFSSRGPTAADGLAKPDVVADGAHVVSLAAPGATITTEFPSSMAAPYRRGSGTSFATGIVSGLVADMLSVAPTMTPDRVKFALMSTAVPDASTDPYAVGSGLVNGYSAVVNAPAGLADQNVTPSAGGAGLAADRGTVELSAAGTTLSAGTGGLTAQLQLFDPVAYLTSPWTEASWLTSQWSGNSWEDNSWEGNSWEGNSWEGNNFSATAWYGNSWAGSAWYGAWDQ